MDGGSMPEKARLHEGILPIPVTLSSWSFKEINSLIFLQHIWLTACTSLLVFNITELLMCRTRVKWSVCGHYCPWHHRLFLFCWAAFASRLYHSSLQQTALSPAWLSVCLCGSSCNLGLASTPLRSVMGNSGMSIWLTCFAVVWNI